jgi:hypothetical protein
MKLKKINWKGKNKAKKKKTKQNIISINSALQGGVQ